MDYTRWSQEYYQKALQVKEDIDRIKKKLKNSHGDEERLLRAALITLRTMYLDCMHTFELLSLRGGNTDAA